MLPDWSIPLGAVYWVTPEGPLPKRVEVLGDYLDEKQAEAKEKKVVRSPNGVTR